MVVESTKRIRNHINFMKGQGNVSKCTDILKKMERRRKKWQGSGVEESKREQERKRGGVDYQRRGKS